MSARRAAAILNSIPASECDQVHIRWVVHGGGGFGDGYGDGEAVHFESKVAQFKCLDLVGNVASFTESNGGAPIDLPLDQIHTVWRRTRKTGQSWEVSIIGSLVYTDGEWLHLPPVR